jgi:transposase
LSLQIGKAGTEPEVVLEATYGWYWAVDVFQACGAHVHLAHPLGVKGFAYRRVLCRIRHRTRYAARLVMPTTGVAARVWPGRLGWVGVTRSA